MIPSRSPSIPFLCLLSCILLLPVTAQSDQGPPPPPFEGEGEKTLDPGELREHLEWLASDERRGRMATSDEARETAAYIQAHMEKHGLKPAGDRKGSFIHRFKVLNKIGHNVCGLLRGTHPSKRREIVVVGAHYDHVGIGAFGSRSRGSRGQIHNGADDNGSGTSALLELIEAFAKEPPERSILFLAFSGEEVGLVGSEAWVKKPTVALRSVAAMVNLDMIGRSTDRYLFVGGLNSCKRGFEPMVRELAKPFGFRLELHGGGQGPSDFKPFHDAKVPVLFLFTNEHPQYHTPEDDIEHMNSEAHFRVVRYAYRLVRELTELKKRPRYTAAKRNAMPASSSRGFDEIAGFLKISATQRGETVVVDSVETNGLGAKMRLAPGDIIRKIGDLEIRSMLDLQSALATLREKATEPVEIERDGKIRKTKVRR